MVKAKKISGFLDKELEIRSIADSSRNGMQVSTTKDIKNIGFAVDASLSTFKKAKNQNIDFLIVHHGILWKGQKDYTGLKREMIRYLKDNRICLYACHLPLDKHRRYGNNIQLAGLLGLKNIKKFGRHHRISIGFQGELEKRKSMQEIKDLLDKKLDTGCKLLHFNKKKIKSIAIVSGGGSSAFPEAYKKRIDCFLTGEAPHYIYVQAKDLRQNMIIAGHYETETLGVMSLMKLIKENFDLKTRFIKNNIED